MATGALDANGVWIYGEDDPASPVSDLLNLGMDSVSDAVGDAKARLTTLEGVDPIPFAIAAGTVTLPASTGAVAAADVTFPAGRFSVAPRVTISVTTTSGELFGSQSSTTATGCTVRAYRATGGTFAAGVVVHWHAVQMTSTAASG